MRSINGWIWRIGGVVGVLWLVGVTLIAPPALHTAGEHDPRISQRLHRAVEELDMLRRENDDIKKVIQEFTKQMKELGEGSGSEKVKTSSVVVELQKKLERAQTVLQRPDSADAMAESEIIPSLKFEQTRRLVENGIRETWWYLQSQLEQLKQKVDVSEKDNIDYILEEGRQHFRVVQYDLDQLSNADGLKSWREREAWDLSMSVQKRLHAIQNPSDCAHAKKLLCNLNKGCGYGCQIHHIVYCFIVAYGTKRTLILKSKGWRYNRNGWEDVFHPMSDSCTDPGGISHAHWPGTAKTQVVELPIIDTLSQRPQYLPLTIPEDLSARIMRLHGNPSVWWVGQFLKYLLKPQPKTQEMFDSMRTEMGFESPIVGLHIRRTDKVGTEAAFHSVEEYMKHAEDYFKSLELSMPKVKRKVYIASDDPSVLTDARNKFPDYTFLGDPNIARTAAVATRYTDASLKGIIADIHFLSLTDYLVCTFSSQVCRIAYEIMQTMHPDASARFRSLDDIYYYGGQGAHNQKARFAHDAKHSNEMDLRMGDIVGIAGNHWNGFSKGVNRRTRQTGLYPSYKMEEVVDVAEMPTFSELESDKKT